MIKANNQQFNNTLSKTNEWLKDIEEELHEDSRQKSYAALKSVLHALRDRLTVEEAVDLGAQLPMLVRGFYYEEWVPRDKPLKIHTENEFLNHVKSRLRPDLDPRMATRAVFKTLQSRVTQGEINDVKSVLPDSLLALWPDYQE